MLEALRARVEGAVLAPGDVGYEEARRVWNARFDVHPAAIARCRDEEDVAAAVRWARKEGQPLAVRGGGHSYAGHGVCRDGLVVDLSAMAAVRVDPEERLATVGAGARWGAVDRATQAHGLATTGGTVSTVGVAGYTLGGGTGYLARAHGMAVDNLLSARVVTADGEVVRAAEDENPELFWALRGGGGNFGVVTRFRFRLHEVGPEVLGGQILHPFEASPDALRFWRDYMAEAPDEVTCYPFLVRLPPLEFIPEAYHGRVALDFVVAHVGSVEAAEDDLRPLRVFGSPILDGVGRQPYVEVQQTFDAGMAAGHRWATRAHYLPALPDEAVDVLLSHAEDLPGTYTALYLEPMGGAVARVDPAATAFPHRNAFCGLHAFPGWDDPEQDEEMLAWARRVHASMAPFATGGAYVNLVDAEEGRAGVEAAYGPHLERLARVKAAWDPENVFRVNHNIQPAADATG